MAKKTFLSPDLGKSSRGKYRNFVEIPKFAYDTMCDRCKVASMLDSSSRFDTVPTCDGRTDGHWRSVYRDSIGRAVKTDQQSCYC